jgi:valyl-tRNA synthetase
MEINSKYQPNQVESKWYKFWLDNKINHATVDNTKKPFTIVIPPPNITGSLHMGHALNNILQDIFIRFNKKNGFNTCWIPGTDHGGIATQNVVEKQLLAKNIHRHEIGREKFLELMWEWRYKTGDTILMQLKKLGCFCDWDKTRFTMDETCANAVYKAFETFFNEGLIYRANYMVNWCPRCHTALSDIEVEHEERNGHLWHIKYPFKDNPLKGIIVATTRPETMLGDTAVAVNPNDDRYKNLIGKTLILPLMNREIKIISDDMVEKKFGSGAVKITPSHDPNDYTMGTKHKLEFINVIDKNGKMTENAGKYKNLDRYEARKRIVNDLEELGFLIKTEKYKNNVSVCYRCNTVIEPLISMQWYLNTKDMAKKAIKASKDGKINFLPSTWEKPYLNWMENLHDWCISRQIWWGHRIPIWYCENCYTEGSKNGIMVSKDKPKACPNCDNTKNFKQDEDVLDTWFSSALWPFSTLGWPEKNENLDYFYPTSVLATGHEILYLWVARMIMMGLKFMNDIPFEKVYIHGIVRDSHGKKMSKSLGNVIDPLEITGKYGTDALRFSLTSNGIMGRDLQVSEETFVMSRNFCNKLWNASRLILTNLIEYKESNSQFDIKKIDPEKLNLVDKWILSILQKTKQEVKEHYDKSDFALVARTMYEFIWNKYCDWYLEIVKTRLYSNQKEEKEAAYTVLIFVLKEILNLINPIMPFITEEINENINKILNIKNKNDSLAITEFPLFDKNFIDEKSELEMQKIIDIVSGVRNIKGEMNIPPSKELELIIKYSDPSKELTDEEILYINKLTKSIKIAQGEKLLKPAKSAASITKDYEIYIPLENLIDLDKEKERLNKELKNIDLELNKINKKLENKNFTQKAPAQEVEKVKSKQKIALQKIQKIKENLKELE